MEIVNTREMHIPVKELYATIEGTLRDKYGIPEEFSLEYMRYKPADDKTDPPVEPRYYLKFRDVQK